MSNPKRIITGIIQLAVVAGVLAVGLNYQYILDRYALATYKPTVAVASMEPRLYMTDYARALLYRADPSIDSKATFNENCETQPGDLELGCYYRNRISVLGIENPDLKPEEDVVMAHELLHAAWDRLSVKERQTLTTQLEAVYAQIADPELKERMAGYAKSEPGQQGNELHSILATERAVLTPELEEYYAKYFTNRQGIVAAHQKYEAVFDTRRQQLEADLQGIRTLKSQLNTLNSQMESYRRAGQIAQYNALVSRQNQMVDNINQRIVIYQKGVDEYNALSLSLDSQKITETESGVK